MGVTPGFSAGSLNLLILSGKALNILVAYCTTAVRWTVNEPAFVE